MDAATDSAGEPRRSQGLLRTIAHALGGTPVELPREGAIGSFARATTWLNSPPLEATALRGRVVLVDFWTYTCVNWLRTAPYVRAWHERYREAGLVVIGVHTPEFGFEHDLVNVRAQVAELAVRYPVAVDNDYGVWNDFANHYWPALYLADAEGEIRYHHFGEGEYAAAEMAIQQLLRDAGAHDLPMDLVSVDPQGLEVAADWSSLRSPETYLGYRQSSGFASEAAQNYDRPTRYSSHDRLPLNGWDLFGEWTQTAVAAVAGEAGTRLTLRFHARDVNLVMGTTHGRPVRFRIRLDGAAGGADAGTDLTSDGTGVVTEPRTYQVVRQRGPIADRTLEVEFDDPGAALYCMTFG